MKNVLIIVLLFTITPNVLSMEKRKGDDQEQGGAKRPRMQEVPAPRVTGFADLPADVRGIILNLLVNAPGRTNSARLQAAAETIRNFMTLNRSMRGYLDNEAINGYLIQQLAQRYTGGNLVEAAVALRTAAGGRWLATQIQQMPAGEQKNKMVTIAGLLLYQAAGDGDLGSASFLLRFLPTIVNYAANGNSALIHATDNGHTAVVERLLAVPGINVNFQTAQTDTALMVASKKGHTAIVERLLAVPGINVNYQNQLGGTALSGASHNGHTAIVERLLAAHGINVNLQNAQGATALMFAAQDGHTAIVERLLAVPGINVNLQNAQGFTVLMYAAYNGHTAIVERLLAVPGINVNWRANNRSTALKVALGSKSPNKDAIIKLLKDHGAVE
jgi:ankyrin repeat protein